MVHAVGHHFARPSGDHWALIFAVAGGQDPSSKSLFVYVAEFNVDSVVSQSFCHDSPEASDSAVGGYRCYFFSTSSYQNRFEAPSASADADGAGFNYIRDESDGADFLTNNGPRCWIFSKTQFYRKIGAQLAMSPSATNAIKNE